MNRRKIKQKNKKKLCTLAETLERESAKLADESRKANHVQWVESVKLAGGVEKMRLNAAPPKGRKKPPRSFKTVDKSSWVTIVEFNEGKGGKLVKLNRVSLRQGLQANLPSFGFSYVLGKWGSLQ